MPEEKKKVLFVIHQLNIGGGQIALLSALNAIDYAKNEVTLYVRKNRLDLLPKVNPKVSRIIVNNDTTHYYRKPYAVFLQLLGLLFRLLGRRGSRHSELLRDYIVDERMKYEKRHYFSDGNIYDIAICYMHGYHALFTARCVDAKRKIMFYHSSTDEYHEIHERVMGDFESVYCVSPGAQQAVRGFYPRFADRIQCLENIVSPDEIRRNADLVKVPFPAGKLILCSCGRFTSVKGFDLAVEAASCLKQKGVLFVWYLVGDGPERGMLENRIKEMGLNEEIVLTGMLSNPHPYMANCDIYVQPSREESQCLAIIEAQVLCRPVVSTRTAGGCTLIQEGVTGILTDINSQALADGIMHLAKDEASRKQMKRSLEAIDYGVRERDFREKWARLLGDK